MVPPVSSERPPEGDDLDLEEWLHLEAECDRELARQFVEARHGRGQPMPALSLGIEALLLATARARAAYRASKK